MGVFKGLTDFLSKKGTVFGSYSKYYNTDEFSRFREDGVPIIDLVPDCRVFALGSELTKDVESVSIDHSLDKGSTCNLVVANPAGKFEIGRNDLRKKWREDKDILAAYDYDDYSRVDPRELLKLIKQGISIFAGDETAEKFDSSYKLAKSSLATLDTLFGRLPTPRTNTRMIFETKHFSGFTKKIGDIIFDYRDPVIVFMKGRFSPYWYFAFSGYIESFDDETAYGSNKSIRIRCVDPTHMWKRTKYTNRAAFYAGANFESRMDATSSTVSSAIIPPQSKNDFPDTIKSATFHRVHYKDAVNCHYSKLLKSQEEGIVDLSKKDAYRNALTYISKYIDVGNGSMYSEDPFDISKGLNDFMNMDEGPNGCVLGPIAPLYLQLNEIELPVFTPNNVEPYLKTSIRMWEFDPILDANNKGENVYTGWKDNKAFAIAGHHPALSYDFINNFSILASVWGSCYDMQGKTNKALSSAVISPIEKIREQVFGSPTEAITDATSKQGTNLNLFRPRLFLILPQKFSEKNRSAGSAPLNTIALFKEDSTTIAEFLKKITMGTEYQVYASPAGDVFIEPEMYDFHPLDFYEDIQIDKTNIVIKEKPIELKSLSNDKTAGAKYIASKAYFYDTNANHPYFITKKDIIRLTQTFKPESIKTHIIVQGSSSKVGFLNTVFDSLAQSGIDTLVADKKSNVSEILPQHYTADGFQESIYDLLGNKAGLDSVGSEIDKLMNNLYIQLIYFIMDTELDLTITEALNHITTGIQNTTEEDAFYLFPVSGSAVKKRVDNWPIAVNAVIDYIGFPYASGGSVVAVDWVLANESLRNVLGISDDSNKTIKKFFIKEEGGNFVNFRNHMLTVARGFGVTSTSLQNFFNLYLYYFISESPTGAKFYKPIKTARTKEALLKSLGIKTKYITLGHLKEFAKANLYNPARDMVRQYGYIQSHTIKNYFIKNGVEALDYAKTMFDKLYSAAWEFSVTTIGRPEYFLNRPYYCEEKDSIGLLKNYSLSFSIGNDFNSNITLSYIRKNILTYAYSQDVLDEVNEGYPFNNTFFESQASQYYLSKKVMEDVGGNISNKKTNTVKSTLIKEVAGDVLGGLYLGGLFSAHGTIGHMDYDKRGFDVTSKPSAANTDSLGATISTFTKEICVEIYNTREHILNLEYEIMNETEHTTYLLEKIDSITNEWAALREEMDAIAKERLAYDLEEQEEQPTDDELRAEYIKDLKDQVNKQKLKSYVDENNMHSATIETSKNRVAAMFIEIAKQKELLYGKGNDSIALDADIYTLAYDNFRKYIHKLTGDTFEGMTVKTKLAGYYAMLFKGIINPIDWEVVNDGKGCPLLNEIPIYIKKKS